MKPLRSRRSKKEAQAATHLGKKWCPSCEDNIPEDKFGLASRNKDGLANVCKSCSFGYVRTAHQRTKEKLSQIKILSGCVDCGYNAHSDALDFDHLPGHVKAFNIGSGQGKYWATIEAEIAKCEVVCANCHRVRTANRRKGEVNE